MLMLTVAGGCELVHIWQLELGRFITCKISIAEADAFVSEFDFWNTSNIGTAKRITRESVWSQLRKHEAATLTLEHGHGTRRWDVAQPSVEARTAWRKTARSGRVAHTVSCGH